MPPPGEPPPTGAYYLIWGNLEGTSTEVTISYEFSRVDADCRSHVLFQETKSLTSDRLLLGLTNLAKVYASRIQAQVGSPRTPVVVMPFTPKGFDLKKLFRSPHKTAPAATVEVAQLLTEYLALSLDTEGWLEILETKDPRARAAQLSLSGTVRLDGSKIVATVAVAKEGKQLSNETVEGDRKDTATFLGKVRLIALRGLLTGRLPMSAGGLEDVAEGQRLLGQGREHRRAKEFDKALLAFARAALLSELRGEALLETGRTYSQQQEYAAAVSHLEEAKRLLPPNTSPLNLLGEAYLKLGDTSSARHNFEESLAMDSSQPEIVTRIGDSYLQEEDNLAAVRYYLVAASQGATPKEQLESAVRKSRSHEVSGILELLKEAPQKNKPPWLMDVEALSWMQLGKLRWDEMRYEEAGNYFQRANEVPTIDPLVRTEVTAWYARVRLALRDFKGADEVLTEVEQLLSDEIPKQRREWILRLRALALQGKGEYESALQKFREAREVMPSRYSELGIAHTSLLQALDLEKQAASVGSSDPKRATQLAEKAHLRLEEAAAVAKRLLFESQGDDALPLYISINRELGKNAESIETLEKLIPQKLDSDSLFFQLGVLYDLQNDPDNALKMYEKAWSLSKEDQTYLNNLAYQYYQRKQYEEAIEKYEIVLKLDTRYLLTYYTISNAYRLTGNLKDALRYQERLVNLLQSKEATSLNMNQGEWFFHTESGQVHFDPNDFPKRKYYAYYNLALTLYLLGSDKQTDEYIRKARDLDIAEERSVKLLLDFDIRSLEKEQNSFKTRLDEFRSKFF